MATSDDAPTHFLSRRSARARLREVAASGSFAELGENGEGVVRDYRHLFLRAMAKAPRRGRVVSAFEHARGHFKDRLSAEEKADFLATLDLYRKGSVPRSAVSSLLETWIRRFGEPCLASQSLFRAQTRAW
jgi:uncharacterized protein YbgA (DUF1722 family)